MLKAPFPWTGGKSRIAPQVWKYLGADVPNYVEPFAGSLACLLGRPGDRIGVETVNDIDGLLCNFWRAVQYAPEETAYWANWPVSEPDLHARHYWLLCQKQLLSERLQADPEFCDPKVAGWWVWGICSWIGPGWCSGNGPWISDGHQLLKKDNDVQGICRQRPDLYYQRGITKKRPELGHIGKGINKQIPYLRSHGMGINQNSNATSEQAIMQTFAGLQNRLRKVRICCGDWQRVLTNTPTTQIGITSVVLDPPYDGFEHLYSSCEPVFEAVCEWASENGDNDRLRIAVCGYEGQWSPPEGWETVQWSGIGYGAGMGTKGDRNRHRERIWFSPHCLQQDAQLSVFGNCV